MYGFILFTMSLIIKLGVYNYQTHYKLYNYSKPITIVEPPVIKIKNRKNNKQVKKSKFNKKIRNFKSTIAINIDNINLNFFYNNLNSIKITKKNFFSKKIAGVYNPIKNKIQVMKKDPMCSINHELLHMSSSYCDKKRKIIFVGFRQGNKKNNTGIGRGLNEGYTEILDHRYFNRNKKSATKYTMCERFAMLIELLVGKDIMEKAYFTANLPLLISELEKYDTTENIFEFIKAIDFYFDYSDLHKDRLIIPSIKRKASKKITEIDDFIINTLNKWFDRRKEIESNTNNILYQKKNT